MTSPRPESSRRAPITIAVGLVVAVGIAARFLTTSDLWLDEALSVNIARLPFGEIAPWLKHDGAPPLFYWLLHGWTEIFGTSDAATRALSGVFGVAALPLAYACGRRIGGVATARAAVVLLALNPFAVRFATEARMYGLEIFAVFAAILCVRRAVERPTPFRLILVAGLSASLIWLHYWCIPLVGGAAAWAAIVAWRTTGAMRAAAVRVAAAITLGGLSFALWLPSLLYQSEHTGTPWATPQLPPIPIARSVLEFAGGDRVEGWTFVYVLVSLIVIGVVGHATSRGTIELDFRQRSSVLPEAVVGVTALVGGASMAYAGGSGYQPRYVAAVLPFVVLVAARGVAEFASAKIRVAVLAVAVAIGCAGVVRNVAENRTQAGDAGRLIAKTARPGDVVVYCPDQLGPATHRVLARSRSDLRELAYPNSPEVGLVDWVDYTEQLDRVTPEQAARTVLAFAPESVTVFVVTAPGYITHANRCDPFIAALAELGSRRPRALMLSDPEVFEHASVIALTVRSAP